MESRFLQIVTWLKSEFPGFNGQLVPLVQDASFRQYYRVYIDNKSYIVMDAPPKKEKPDIFFRLTRLLRFFQLNTPECYAYEQQLGFLLLDDFGDQQLFHYISQSKDFKIYDQVLALISCFWQIDHSLVPEYQASKLASEIDLMKSWFFQWLGIDGNILQDILPGYQWCRQLLVNNAVSQPSVFVYRDFHAKNIMCLGQQFGLIDFQDAVSGPLTYDLVSILKDCYIELPKPVIQKHLIAQYHQAKKMAIIANDIEFEDFKRWFDLMGLQRHMKCLGIFTRQYLQNHNQSYLAYLPQVMRYIDEVLEAYESLSEFAMCWRLAVKPKFKTKYASIDLPYSQ
ncbi:aminoglycoside phosphotransferase family protein [Facilibium subflavum]|uniref:aminoglycoside phosphotransferase family protein n=1 Tax=Facilibium subflavum TaxID=2219058 RepID=UPI000E651914|nr:phosphotransferase [Facilibium subflavum]